MRITVEAGSWPYKTPFRVSRGAESTLEVMVVRLTDAEGRVGRGEAAGVDYDGESVATMRAQIDAVRPALERGVEFAALAGLLPAGGARNAVDCALWDLHAKQQQVRAFELAGIHAPRRLTSCVTLGIDTDQAVAAGAARYAQWPLLKVKVDGTRHLDAIRLVHAANPAARMIVDPNQAWSCDLLNHLAAELQSLNVVLIEQPVPRGEDESLRGYTGAIRLAADESITDRTALPKLRGLYQIINIKLDKTGGLTEALALASEARAAGFGLMVGCMAGTSLAMAPGMVVGQFAEFIDLDGPLLHTNDREHGIQYDRGLMDLPRQELWG